jgi:hypothetical protein
MAGTETKHFADTYIGSIPHSGMFIVSPNTCMYRKGNNEFRKLAPVEKKTGFLFSIGLRIAPSYFVVVTYAVVQFCLHANENFLRVCRSIRC